MPRVAVLNQKGGVGKTTVTLGLTSAAAHRGRSAMVIDLDPQASATWTLGLDSAGGLDAALAAGGASAAKDAVRASSWGESVSVISGGPNLEGWLPNGGPKTSARSLAKALGTVDNDVDWTFLDCPPGLGPLTVNALAAADLALVVVEPSAFANNTMEPVADLIDDVWDRFNPNLDLAGVIMNRVPAVGREAEHRMDELAKTVGKRSIWKPSIPQRVIVNEALGARKPIHAFGARSADVAAGPTPDGERRSIFGDKFFGCPATTGTIDPRRRCVARNGRRTRPSCNTATRTPSLHAGQHRRPASLSGGQNQRHRDRS